jgi:sugar phosphate isomerase/epimerase
MDINRRHFLRTTTSATAGVLLSSFTGMTLPDQPTFTVNRDFKLLLMATDWGFNGNRDQFCAAVKKEGYDGIEAWWPAEASAQTELFEALKKYDLKVGFLCGSGEAAHQEHLANFKRSIDACTATRYQKPVYINCHSGRDFFTYEQNKLFIDHTTKSTKETGVPIYHETHRSRMLFAAHIARQFIERNPALRLTLDISHWCNVHESLLADQQQTVAMALERTDHIHARIGHPEGPQVNDPRAPEWEDAVKAHFGWWDTVIERKKQQGAQVTILTEFGPPDYLPTLPYTKQPVADQWAINVHMMNIIRKRYQ